MGSGGSQINIIAHLRGTGSDRVDQLQGRHAPPAGISAAPQQSRSKGLPWRSDRMDALLAYFNRAAAGGGRRAAHSAAVISTARGVGDFRRAARQVTLHQLQYEQLAATIAPALSIRCRRGPAATRPSHIEDLPDRMTSAAQRSFSNVAERGIHVKRGRVPGKWNGANSPQDGRQGQPGSGAQAPSAAGLPCRHARPRPLAHRAIGASGHEMRSPRQSMAPASQARRQRPKTLPAPARRQTIRRQKPTPRPRATCPHGSADGPPERRRVGLTIGKTDKADSPSQAARRMPRPPRSDAAPGCTRRDIWAERHAGEAPAAAPTVLVSTSNRLDGAARNIVLQQLHGHRGAAPAAVVSAKADRRTGAAPAPGRPRQPNGA